MQISHLNPSPVLQSMIGKPASVALFLLAITACRQPTREELRQEFVRGCYVESDHKTTDTRLRRIYHDYCDCAAWRIVNGFSKEELDALNKLKQEGHSTEALQKMEPAIRPCLDDLKNRLGMHP